VVQTNLRVVGDPPPKRTFSEALSLDANFPPALCSTLLHTSKTVPLFAIGNAFERGFPYAGYRYAAKSLSSLLCDSSEGCPVFGWMVRLAHMLHDSASHVLATATMDVYATKGSEPHPFSTLHDWYVALKQSGKAQKALECGVVAREPQSVMRRVEYESPFALFLPSVGCV
jgi:hypothetical protein